MDSELGHSDASAIQLTAQRPEDNNHQNIQAAANSTPQAMQLQKMQSAANDHVAQGSPLQRTASMAPPANDMVIQRVEEDELHTDFPEGVSEDYRKIKGTVQQLLATDQQKLAYFLGNQKYAFSEGGVWTIVSVVDYQVVVEQAESIDSKVNANELWEKPADAEVIGPNKFAIIAHRGRGPTSHLSGKDSESGGKVPEEMAPENTMKAFSQAFSMGADGFELDVYVTADNIPIVIHDDELNRNVEGADRKGLEMGMIGEMTFAETQGFNVGQGEKIPSLMQVMELAGQENQLRSQFGKRNLFINIELKGKGAAVETAKVATNNRFDLFR